MKQKRTLRQIFNREIPYHPGLDQDKRVTFLDAADNAGPVFTRVITFEEARAAMARSRARRAALSDS